MRYFKTSAFLVFFLLTARVNYAQSLPKEQSVTSIFKLNFFLPGVSYEQKLATYETIYFNGYMDVLINSTGVNGTNQAHVFFTPTLDVEIRNYYNLNKRERLGRRTAMNSGNYLAPVYYGRYSQVSDFEDREWINQVGAVWGMQRNARQGFSLDLSFGLSYTFDSKSYDYYNPVGVIAQLTLGFWLGKRPE